MPPAWARCWWRRAPIPITRRRPPLEQVASWQGINLSGCWRSPDLILAWRGGNPQRVLDQLAAFGIPIFADADNLGGSPAAG